MFYICNVHVTKVIFVSNKKTFNFALNKEKVNNFKI